VRKIVVTGGAGFVGSNVVAGLNARGFDQIIVVDHFKNGRKMQNLADLEFLDYFDRDDFIAMVRDGRDFGDVGAILHNGACSATTEWDGQYLMRNNFEYSKDLLHWCQRKGVQYVYASSASVYGMGSAGFREERACEKPINMYAFSKWQFDQYVRKIWSELTTQVVGLRYFNVYGPRESHKGSMASTAFHFNNQILATGVAKLFSGCDGYGDGEQRRDFVHVADCVDVALWFLDNPGTSGIFNLGTGQARTFNDMARAIVDWHRTRMGMDQATTQYVPFPDHLRGAYQSFTEADISSLRAAGYSSAFRSLEAGVAQYLDYLNAAELVARAAR
jgi:ADP-L-glycero-D-manno-heptose 6-epimerase